MKKSLTCPPMASRSTSDFRNLLGSLLFLDMRPKTAGRKATQLVSIAPYDLAKN